jgi:hypothetical protein
VNTELFRKIDEVIAIDGVEPDYNALEMASWEDDSNTCGTTRCVAGWGIYLTTGKPLYDGRGDLDPSVIELANQHGVEVKDHSVGGKVVDFEELGAAILDLEGGEKHLFYVSEETAVEFVHFAAQGQKDRARRVLGL